MTRRRSRFVLHVCNVARYNAQRRRGMIADDDHAPLYLIRLMDEVLERMEQEPRLRHFALDGESSLIEAYLKARPEQAERVSTLVKDGRLLLGPWYIAPEPALTNVESLIRNLLLGLRTARVFGQPMMVGYLPEASVLHTALPQILKSFGIKTVLASSEETEEVTEFQYRGLDGTLAIVGDLREGVITTEDTLVSIRHKLAPLSDSGHVLMLSQWQVGTSLKKAGTWLRKLDRAASDLQDDVIVSSPQAFANALEVNVLNSELPIYDRQPELTAAGRQVRDWNVGITRGVLRWIEPFFAWAENAQLGRTERHLRHPQTLIQDVWRQILRDQASPELHEPSATEQLAARTRYYRERVDDLRDVPLNSLTEHIDTQTLPVKGVTALVVYNSASQVYRGGFRFRIGWARSQPEIDKQHSLVVYNAGGQRVGMAVPSDQSEFVQELHFSVEIPAFGYNSYSVALEPTPSESILPQGKVSTAADLLGYVTAFHAGSLPTSTGLIRVSDWRFEVTTIKLPENPEQGGMILRGSCRVDDPLTVTITPWRVFKKCEVVSMDEVPIGGTLAIDPATGTFKFKATAHRLITLWLHD